MNDLAKELNQILEGTIVSEVLSDLGKNLFFPKGIVSQSAEASKLAKKYNATIGMAFEESKPMILPSIDACFNGLSSAEAVAYAPTGGVAELRSLWKEQIVAKNEGVEADKISLPVVVPGLTNGILQAADLFVNEGDNVVIPDMFWGNYKLIFEVKNKANIKKFPFFEGEGFNIAGYEKALRENAVNKKIVTILNYPNNPTGYSPTVDEANKITEMFKTLAEEGFKIVAITDDAYFGLFFGEDTYKKSIFTNLYNLHENILAVKGDAATKEDFVWGFRVGFLTFGSKGLTAEHYEALNKKLMGNVRGSVSNTSKPSQSVLIKAIKNDSYQSEKDHKNQILQIRHNAVQNILKNRTTGLALKPLPFNSGYFMSFLFEGGDAEELRVKLLQEKGIGTISIEGKYLRIAFASVDLEYLEDLYNEVFASADELTK